MRSSLQKLATAALCLICFQIVQASWTRQNSATLAWLRSVYFVDADNGWIVGSKGTLLETHDGGKTWTARKHVTEENIRDVYFADRKNGWLLCEGDIFKSSSRPVSFLMRTTDGGATWDRVDFVGAGNRLVKFFFARSGAGVAVGEGGVIWTNAGSGGEWHRKNLPVKYVVLGGTFADETHAVLVGGGGTILYSTDGIDDWSRASVTGENENLLESVFLVDATNGWAVGTGGKIYATNNAGKVWREQSSGVADDLTDIVFTDPKNGFAIGRHGTILATTDGGLGWHSELPKITTALERMAFNGKTLFAVGFGGTILRREVDESRNTEIGKS